MADPVVKQNVGIDVSMNDFSVCLYQKLETRGRVKSSKKFKNTPKGFDNFLEWVNTRKDKNTDVTFTMEATGVYYENLAHHLYNQGLSVSVQLPNIAKSYIKSLGVKTKTDKVDARALGQMGVERNLKLWQPGSKQMRQLKLLSRERVAIIRERTAIKNRLHAQKYSYKPQKKTLKRLEQRIRLANKQVKIIEKRIKELIEMDPELKEKVDKICLIKGLGITTVVTIIAEANGFELFKSMAQLVSYAGYDVVENQSGKHNGKTKISKKGNSYIRGALHFPAITAKKHEPVFKDLYDRVLKETHIGMKACVAVQRKLLVMIYTLYKKNEAFDPNFHLIKREESEQAQVEMEKQGNTTKLNGTDKNNVDRTSLPTLDETSKKASPLILQS